MVDNVHPGAPVGQLFAHLASGGGRRALSDAPYSPPPSQVMSPTQPGSTPRGATQNQNPQAGMPGGSGAQIPAHKTFRMLAEVIHLRRGDEEASRERFFYEQQQAQEAAQEQQQTHRQELEHASQIVRSELTLEEEQQLNQYVTEGRTYFTSLLRNVESKVSHARIQLQ